jgi:trehalose/maltose transport system permease protein
MSATTVESRSVRQSKVSRRALRWHPGERLGYAMVAPAVLVLLAITAYPLVVNINNSLHSYNLLYPTAGNPYVGLRNYRDVFRGVGLDVGLGTALMHTMGYALVSVVIEVVLGLGIALLLDRPIRGRGVARTMILLPWAVPTVVAAIVWKTLLDQQTGGVDYFLGLLGLPHTQWLGASTLTSWASILIADSWQTVPFVAIILLAGLQGIPRELYEAAEVDGASRWHVFTNITLPMLRPALLVVLVFRTLSAFLIFDIIYAMTQGGPGTATETVAFQNFGAIITNLDFGLGGAISVVMVIVALVIAWVYRLTLKPAA